MPKSWFYDLIYRFGAPWEIGVRSELRELVKSGRVAAEPGARAIDLGCGSGANTIFLAQQGWETIGIDYSAVALKKAVAKAKAADSELSIGYVQGDLTADSIAAIEGPFDFLLDYGTLDHLKGDARQRMAELISALAAPGARFLLWCFYATMEDMPRISFKGSSRMAPAIAPGEVEKRFGTERSIEHLPEPPEETRTAAFLLTRNAA